LAVPVVAQAVAAHGLETTALKWAGFRTIYRQQLPAYLDGQDVKPEGERHSQVGQRIAYLLRQLNRR
jgi:hypothetical protein